MVQPNQGKVMTLFGSYVGTVQEARISHLACAPEQEAPN
jgi:hypothetical protein